MHSEAADSDVTYSHAVGRGSLSKRVLQNSYSFLEKPYNSAWINVSKESSPVHALACDDITSHRSKCDVPLASQCLDGVWQLENNTILFQATVFGSKTCGLKGRSKGRRGACVANCSEVLQVSSTATYLGSNDGKPKLAAVVDL